MQWRVHNLTQDIADNYEPGSTFKLMTVSTAYDLGATHAEDTFLGCSSDSIVRRLSAGGVPTDTDYTVLIDYAHSPRHGDGAQAVVLQAHDDGVAQSSMIALRTLGTGKRQFHHDVARLCEVADFLSFVQPEPHPRSESPNHGNRAARLFAHETTQAAKAHVIMEVSDTPMQVIVDRPEAIHWSICRITSLTCDDGGVIVLIRQEGYVINLT